MPVSEHRFRSLLRGLAEPVLALTGAFTLTLLLTLPFVPTRAQVEIPLRPQPDGEVLGHEELERETEALGLADDVRVMLVQGASRLVLKGVEDPERAGTAVVDLLERSGYQRDEWVRREVVHMEAMLRAEPRTLPLLMSIQAVVFLAGGLLLARGRVDHAICRPATSRPRAVLLGVASGIAAVVLSAVVSFLLKLLGMPVEEQAWLVELYGDPGTLLRISPWVVLISPLSEEIFFRFYVFRFITAHAGFPTGLVVSSLMFAMIHLNPSGLLIYLGIGCVMAWVYRRTGRLVAPIVGHVTLNAIVLISSALAVGPEL
jgi:membrane protease YdiL (CAAX protease family)